ncbi:MAG: transglycosylase domain-containing protein [Eubacterium sp.]|nr:transglycosylase domain-containing protein [Eubacterium sp.]
MKNKCRQWKEQIEKLRAEKRWFDITCKIITFPFYLLYHILNFILTFSKVILNVILLLMVVFGIVGGIFYAKMLPMYQDASEQAYEKLSNLNENSFHMFSNTVVYDKDGKKIGEIDSGSYKYVKINKISDYIQYGYIATEDKKFMEHGGIDLQSILRAGISLITNKGEITQGGSTITQQVIKNNLLTQEQSFGRKMTEVLLAPALERKYNKADIMEFYCNSNFYGNQCYGVETASKFYFGCSAKDVSLAQAAMLCGISNSPNKYNPIASMKLAKEKQTQVLNNMLEQGYITQKQYDKAKKEEITIVGLDTSASSENYMVSYAIDRAAIQLMKDNGFKFQYVFSTQEDQDNYTKKYSAEYSKRSAEIRAGGYKIYTSLNPKIQKRLQKSVSRTLSTFTEKSKKTKKYALQSAAMCIDNESQYVVAVVGGRTNNDEYNRAFLSKRQPGSTIKPLLDYAPAVDNGVINGSSIINDHKVYWDSTNPKSYSPSNSGGGYRGNVSIREALARSINTVAFQVFKEVGSDIAMDYLNKLQFSSLSYADNTAPAVSLGGFTYGVTINDMCRGYATLENNGKMSSRTCLVKIEHETNGTVYQAPDLEDSETEVYSADTAFIMKDMMQGTFNESYGTGHAGYNDKQIYAGKTGTTSSNKDAWFCGFSSYYTTAVWIGYDTPRKMPGMYGSTYPLRIWSSFMDGLHSKKEKANFEIPETIELRRVSGGNLTDSAKEINYDETKRYYSQRPGGYDYYSQQNNDRKSTWEKEYKLSAAKKEAEKAVAAFEKYKIKDVKTASAFESEYDEVMAVIAKIPDEYEQGPYKERVAAKYNSLKDVVKKKWQKAIDEEKEAEADKQQKQQKIDAEDASTEANNTLKANRIKKAKWYIDALKKRKYYTNTTKALIKDGKKAIERLKGYSEYNSYKSSFDSAVERAEKLPKKQETPDIPGSGSDNSEVDPNKYTDPTSTPTETPVPVQ